MDTNLTSKTSTHPLSDLQDVLGNDGIEIVGVNNQCLF